MATALRPIAKLFGKSYAAGDHIPDDVVVQMTPQALRALINGHMIEVAGMEADAGAASAHLKAKLDKHDERLKKAESNIAVSLQANDDLAARLSEAEAQIRALRGSPTKSKRQARQEAEGK